MTDWRVVERGECCCRARATAAKVALLLLLLVVNQVKELVSLKLKRRVNGWLGWVGLGLGMWRALYPVQCKLNSPLALKNGGHTLLLKKEVVMEEEWIGFLFARAINNMTLHLLPFYLPPSLHRIFIVRFSVVAFDFVAARGQENWKGQMLMNLAGFVGHWTLPAQ